MNHKPGQREQSEIGLYYYGARWYDSSLGRFTTPDSIVPGAGNPLAWDRFAYTLNNPVLYIDPSGHLACDAEHVAEGDCSTWSSSSKFGISSETGIKYGNIRRSLIQDYGFTYVDENTGQINDTALLSLIISAEFADIKHISETVFNEALEALSNQYYSTQGTTQTPCLGNCSLADQFTWLDTAKRGISLDSNNTAANFPNFLADATRVRNGYSYGPRNDSWEWGNAKEGSNIYNWIIADPPINKGSRYINGIVYGNSVFFVVTSAQNLLLTKEDRGW